MRRRTLVALAAAWLAFWAGRDAAAADRSGTFFPAADLAFAFRELAPRFEGATGVRGTLVFGSTGTFAQQIRPGGPADGFFAADEAFLGRALGHGGGAARRHCPAPEFTGPRSREGANGTPAPARHGRAAEEVLRRTGLWEAL